MDVKLFLIVASFLYISTNIYKYIYIFVYVCICIYIHTYMHTYTHASVVICRGPVYVYVRGRVGVRARVCIYMYV